jgi:hypothetical protein
MKRPFSALAWKTSTRGVRNLAAASLLSMAAAIALLAYQGIRATRVDFIVLAAALVGLLGIAWIGTRWSTGAGA